MTSNSGGFSAPCPSLGSPSQFAYCYFSYKQGASVVPETRIAGCSYGILLRVRLQEVPMAILTSYQTLPSPEHARGLYFRVVKQGKEYDVAELLSSSLAELFTCCGDQHSLWKNTGHHIGSICPRKGDFAVLLLKSTIAREVLSKMDGRFQVAGLLDCMSLEEIQQVVVIENRVITVNVCGEESSQDLELKIDCTSLLQPGSSPDHHVRSYCHSYMQLAYNAESSRQACGLGLPIVYRKSGADRCKLFGMHVYLEAQSAQYGVLLVHIIDLLRSHQPASFPYYGKTYSESYILNIAFYMRNNIIIFLLLKYFHAMKKTNILRFFLQIL